MVIDKQPATKLLGLYVYPEDHETMKVLSALKKTTVADLHKEMLKLYLKENSYLQNVYIKIYGDDKSNAKSE